MCNVYLLFSSLIYIQYTTVWGCSNRACSTLMVQRLMPWMTHRTQQWLQIQTIEDKSNVWAKNLLLMNFQEELQICSLKNIYIYIFKDSQFSKSILCQLSHPPPPKKNFELWVYVAWQRESLLLCKFSHCFHFKLYNSILCAAEWIKPELIKSLPTVNRNLVFKFGVAILTVRNFVFYTISGFCVQTL